MPSGLLEDAWLSQQPLESRLLLDRSVEEILEALPCLWIEHKTSAVTDHALGLHDRRLHDKIGQAAMAEFRSLPDELVSASLNPKGPAVRTSHSRHAPECTHVVRTAQQNTCSPPSKFVLRARLSRRRR
jgi:hypothetical protein